MKRLRRPNDLAAIARRQILTTSQAAELCAVDRRTMLNWVKSGRVRAHKTGGGQNRVLLADLLAFMCELGIPVPEGVSPNARVAIVDEDRGFLRKVEKVIHADMPSAEIRSASNGFMAGALVASFQPHLLLVDTAVAGVDGVELCRWIRDNANTRYCGIIVTTASLAPKDQGKLSKVGASGYLDRADDGEGLRDVMVEHLPVRLTGWT